MDLISKKTCNLAQINDFLTTAANNVVENLSFTVNSGVFGHIFYKKYPHLPLAGICCARLKSLDNICHAVCTLIAQVL